MSFLLFPVIFTVYDTADQKMKRKMSIFCKNAQLFSQTTQYHKVLPKCVHITSLINWGDWTEFYNVNNEKDPRNVAFPVKLDPPFALSHPHPGKWFWGHRRRSWSPCWPPSPLLHTRTDSGTEPWSTNLKSRQPGSFHEEPLVKQIRERTSFQYVHADTARVYTNAW